MDPFTAMAIITVVSAGASYLISNSAKNSAIDEQNRIQQQQEQARVAATQREVGIAQQRTNTTLTGAKTRSVNSQQSFSSNSIMGALPSVQSRSGNSAGTGNMNAGSAGTF